MANLTSELIQFKDIIPHIINQLAEKKIYFGKTKIIKIAYLLELEYYKINHKHLTNANWIFYKYGPYPINYNDYLEQDNIITSDDDSFQRISVLDDFELPKIPAGVKTLLNGLILEYGDMDINELLNYVYFETEPMVYATPRSELDFSLVKKEDIKAIEICLSSDQKKRIIEIRKRLSNKLSELPEPRFQTKFVSEEIFEDSDMKYLVR